jgi:hypothetical protein
MRVILLSADTKGAARKVHSDVRVDLPSAGDTRAENRDHRRMCVDPPSTADSGAAHKVDRRMRVDLRCTGETGAENRDRRRMCVDPPSTADSGAAHKVHRRIRVDLRCTGETRAEDKVHLRMRLNLLFAARSGARQRAAAGQRAGGRLLAGTKGAKWAERFAWRTEGAGARFWWCKGLPSTVPSSTSALKARVPDFGGVKGCHPPSHHPHPP